ncbi:tRNA pseudouridine(55) synthase, partial [Candidatus Saccharibacteria bacterium CG10_big_fil_rev_8_21_14_0_10_41_32]
GIAPSMVEVLEVLEHFKGEITQRPPIYSAIHINGQRAYDLARAGKEFEMPQRQITIHSLELIDYTYPELKIRANVSSGTYIRTLAEDIGKSLGTGAYCSQLRRISIADWHVDNAVTLQSMGITD